MNHGECDWERWDDEERSKETVAARLFSSGTTGLPKAVEMTHYNFIAQHTMVLEWKPRDYEVSCLLYCAASKYFPLILDRLSGSFAHQCSTSAMSPAHIQVPFAAA
jgi:acyl-coenzyme A synthetase/AMP-(fatty) acid ligase